MTPTYCLLLFIDLLESFTDLASVRMITGDSNDLLVEADESIALQWLNSSLFPLAGNTSEYTIDIQCYWLDIQIMDIFDINSSVITPATVVSTGVPNGGSASITVPPITSSATFTPILFKVIINVSSSSSDDPYISALQSLYTQTPNRVGIWSHIMILRRAQSDYSWNNIWILQYSSSPVCPCNINQANLPNSGFEPNVSPGRRIMDQYLHPNATLCYTSTDSVNV